MKKILLLCLLVTTGGFVSAQSCAPVSSGLKAWWQAESNGLDYVGGDDAIVKSGVSYTTGVVGSCFDFDGSVNGLVGLGTSVGNFGTNDFSVEFWENVPTNTTTQSFIGNAPNSASWAFWEVNLGLYFTGSSQLTFIIGSDNVNQGVDYLASSRNVADGTWHHIACTRSNAGGGAVVMSIYVDGVLDTNKSSFVINPNQTLYGLRLGNDQYYQSYLPTNSLMDEVALYSRALSGSEIASIYSAGTNGLGLCCANISITGQPKSAKNITTTNLNAAFGVTNLGTPPYFYQWYHTTGGSTIPLTNGLNPWGSYISGATSSNLLIVNPLDTNNDLGAYSVVVSNSCTAVTSDFAYLDIAPVITTPPSSTSATIGSTATFSVVASGVPLSYKWLDNGVALNNSAKYGSSTNTATLTVLNVQGSDADTYSVVITNHGGSVTSSGVTLSTPPQITTQPVYKTNSCGASVTYTIAATGTATLTYQWQSNTVNNTTFTNIPGETTKNLTIAGIDPSWSTNQYRCIVSNPIGVVTSTNAYLYVKATVSVPPAGGNICDGTPVTLSVTPCTSDTTSYQWRKNGVAISGATAPTYTTATAGSYTVVIGNHWGTDTSSPSAILKSVTSPAITLAPQSQTVLLGNAAYFNANATGTTPTYAWIKDGSSVVATGVTNYTISSVAATDAGSYVFQAANGCNTTNSTPPAVLTVVSTPQCATNFVDSSLVDWWKFESNVVDSIGTNNGTATGLTYAAGEVNTAIQFDGTTNASLTYATNVGNFGTNDFTVEFWMNTSSTNNMTFIEKNPACWYVGAGWDIRISTDFGPVNGHVSIEAWANNVGYGGTEHTYTLCDGHWHHLAMVRSGRYVYLYVDGANQADATLTTPTVLNLNNTMPLLMGRTICEGTFGVPYNGMLDEVTFYNRALSAAEINTIYNASTQGKCGP